jgi:uncharacterized protein
VDASEPGPEAAVDFYSGLFGWEFEDAMPPGSEGKYFIARLRGSDVAAVGSIPEAAPPTAMWNTYVWVESGRSRWAHSTWIPWRIVLSHTTRGSTNWIR